MPTPTVRVIAPLLLIAVAAPPKLNCQLLSPWRSNVPLLLKVPPLPASITPPDHVTTPPVVRVRRWKLFDVVLLMVRLFVPERIVDPVPSIPPPVQVLAPLTVNAPVPASVPPERFRAPKAAALLMPAVPPDTLSAPLVVAVPSRFKVPLETPVDPLCVSAPTKLAVLPLTSRLPAPLTPPLTV